MPSPSAMSTYRAGNAWFVCDRCSQRWRRAAMLAEWTNLRVCPVCIDPRPPQMSPPDVFPEGLPFEDTRAPQDNGDAMQDDSSIYPVTGGVRLTTGQYSYEGGQISIGRIAPQSVFSEPAPAVTVNLVNDDIGVRTGPVTAPTAK